MTEIRVVTSGLQFPEGPVALDDGSILVVEIRRGTLTRVFSDGTQQIVSAALDPDLLHEVQKLLRDAEQKREDEIPCVGFHCLLKRKDEST